MITSFTILHIYQLFHAIISFINAKQHNDTTDSCDVITGEPSTDAYLKFVYVFISLIGWQFPLIVLIWPKRMAGALTTKYSSDSLSAGAGESFLEPYSGNNQNSA
jgi:hypothetical protein